LYGVLYLVAQAAQAHSASMVIKSPAMGVASIDGRGAYLLVPSRELRIETTSGIHNLKVVSGTQQWQRNINVTADQPKKVIVQLTPTAFIPPVLDPVQSIVLPKHTTLKKKSSSNSGHTATAPQNSPEDLLRQKAERRRQQELEKERQRQLAIERKRLAEEQAALRRIEQKRLEEEKIRKKWELERQRKEEKKRRKKNRRKKRPKVH
jgi:hypothetical protein